MESITLREKTELESLDLINKFRKQTTRRLQHLEDRFKAENDDEILERYPFQADEADIYQNPLVHAVELFLLKYYCTL